MLQVRASLNIGEQLSDLRFVRNLPITLSPMATCIFACGSEEERRDLMTRLEIIKMDNPCLSQ